jgi:hypothetical protein
MPSGVGWIRRILLFGLGCSVFWVGRPVGHPKGRVVAGAGGEGLEGRRRLA